MKLFLKVNTISLIIIIVSFISISEMSTAQSPVTKFRNLVSEKKYEEAALIAPQALAEMPNDADFSISVGDVYFELEEYNNALDAYRKAFKINNKNNSYVAKIADALSALNQTKEAIDELQKILNKDKKNVELIISLANAYLTADDINNAQLQITNARSIDSKNPRVFFMLGNIYYKQSI